MLGFLLFLLSSVFSQGYDPNLFSLGNNIVINPTFSDPNLVAPRASKLISTGILGWNCTIQCQVVNIPRRCAEKNITCNTTFIQAIEFDSKRGFVDHYSQNIQINTEGKYLLRGKWMPSLIVPLGKNFGVNINGTQIAKIVVVDTSYI